MSLREWWSATFGQHRSPTQAQVVLSQEESKQASRLARLTGSTRDQVLREAYRKSDLMLTEYEEAENQRLGR